MRGSEKNKAFISSKTIIVFTCAISIVSAVLIYAHLANEAPRPYADTILPPVLPARPLAEPDRGMLPAFDVHGNTLLPSSQAPRPLLGQQQPTMAMVHQKANRPEISKAPMIPTSQVDPICRKDIFGDTTVGNSDNPGGDNNRHKTDNN